LLVAAAIIGFFVLACAGSATRDDVTTGFDEPAQRPMSRRSRKPATPGRT
jgi:hypothetical protein